MLQCGDPKGDGTGGPGYSYGPVENAPADNVYPAGTIAMARQSDNAYSKGSQFFIVYDDTTIPADQPAATRSSDRSPAGSTSCKSQITDKGVQGGGTDGKPAVPPRSTPSPCSDHGRAIG